MRFAPAKLFAAHGRPRRWTVGLVLVVVVAVAVAVTLTLTRTPQTAVLPRPHPHVDQAATHTQLATTLLGKLTTGLSGGSRADVVSLAAHHNKSAGNQLSAIYSNVHRLDIVGLRMRYVDDDAGALSAARQAQLGGGAWVGQVDLHWRIRGYDHGAADMEVSLTLVETAHGARFASARGDFGDAAPLWLLEPVKVRRASRWLVMVAGTNKVGRFASLAADAVTDVDKVLTGWHGRLVVEVPDSENELDHVLGASADQYADIAAVTTTVDGTMSRSAPVHIFVNPPVFDPLGPHGSRIVLSHEATHVATHAVTTSMPTWLLEGFADYVALDHVNLPVSVTGSEILGEVRKDGPPSHLPNAKDFATSNTALGASYEAAWLACRLLAQTYGENKLIAFYRMSARDSSTSAAFEKVFGTDKDAFTRAWQRYLARLAG